MDKNQDSDSDWQTRCEKTRQRLGYLWKTKLWADCKFLVGDGSPEEVSAHKFVLAMSSPVFEAMFYGEMAEGSGPIAVTDVVPDAFKSLLEFLYTDNGVINTYSEASELYYVAKKYIVPYIQQRCISHMLFTLAPQNACFAYEFAQLFEEKDLLQAALKKIRRQTKEVLLETCYEDIQLSTLVSIFSEKYLDIDSELDLFNAAEKFAQAHGLKSLKRKSLQLPEAAKKSKLDKNHIVANESTKDDDNTQTQTEENSEQLQKIRKAISHIRFLTLSAKDFARVALSALLTDEEALAIMLNLAAEPAPIPEGLNSCRDKRTATCQPPLMPQMSDAQFEAICVFRVLNFKTRKRPVNSSSFYTDDFEWTVQMRPGTEFIEGSNSAAGQKMLGVYVNCQGNGGSLPWGCMAQVSIQLLSDAAQPLVRSFNFHYTQWDGVHTIDQ